MPLIVDGFDQGNSNPLVSPDWSTLVGASAHKRLNGMAQATADTICASSKVSPALINVNQFAQVVVGDIPADGNYISVACRVKSTDSLGTLNCYQLSASKGALVPGQFTAHLRKYVNGSSSNLSQVVIDIQPGDIMRLEVSGNTVRGTHIRGAVVTTIGLLTDTSIATGNYQAIISQGTGSRLGNFQAGDLTLAPTAVILGPLYATEVAAFGIGTPGSTVEVWKNGMALAPTTVADAKGRWVYVSALALMGGDVLKVRERRADGLYTAFSGTVTVSAATSKPPVVDEPLYAGCTDITGSAKIGALKVTVYKNGGSIGDAVPTATGRFRLTGAALTAGSKFTAKQTITTTQSAASDEVIAKAAPTDTDAYKTKVFALLDAFDFVRTVTDTDDIRRGIASVLEAVALEGLTTHQIDNGMLFLAGIQALNIWYVNN